MDLSSKRIMVAGHICLDIAPRFRPESAGGIEEILVPGKLVNIHEAVLCTGGTVSNTGLSLAKLGADVVLNGKVGNDQFGRIIKECVGTQRASAFKTVEHQNTSYTVILAIPGVDRIFLHNPGTNDTFGADDIDYDAARSCMLFHFGYPPLMKRMFANDGAELIDMFRRVHSMGVTTSLDMSLPDPASESGKANWQKILKDLLPYVDIFLPSIEEVAFMLDRELFNKRKAESGGRDAVHAYRTADYQRLSDMLLDMGVKMAAMKSGIRGYYLRTSDKIADCGKAAPKDNKSWRGRELWCASFKATQFGSATGAGDATIAGFIAGLVAGFGPEKSLRVANTVGWENVRAIDALSGIEDWAATLKYLDDTSRPRNDPGLDGTWSYDTATMVYRGSRDGKP
jgi:sugar/nucleoside kinase (ribokinase family)